MSPISRSNVGVLQTWKIEKLCSRSPLLMEIDLEKRPCSVLEIFKPFYSYDCVLLRSVFLLAADSRFHRTCKTPSFLFGSLSAEME